MADENVLSIKLLLLARIITHVSSKTIVDIIDRQYANEWIMERYAISQDTKSLIINDINEWSREHNNPTYIFDLLLSVINLSLQTIDIVNNLPKLNL
jgi:predicted helicase